MVSLYDIFRGDVMPQSGVKVSIGRNTYDGAAPSVPVNDMHLRVLNLYDVSTSGTVTFNSASERLDLNINNRPVQPIVTAVMIEMYDSDATGSHSFSSTGGTPIVMATVSFDTYPGLFTTGGGGGSEVSIGFDGLFEMTWRASCIDDNGWARDAAFTIWLEEDVGGGFVEVPGTRSYSTMVVDGGGAVQAATANGSTLVQVANGNTYRVMIDNLTAGSTANMVQNGSLLRIKKMS